MGMFSSQLSNIPYDKFLLKKPMINFKLLPRVVHY